MKKVTNKTILKQSENTYQPIEIDGLIYWVDDKPKGFSNGEWMYNEPNNNTLIYQFDYDVYPYETGNKLIAQSRPKLEAVPVIDLDSYIFNFLDKACSDWYRQEYGVMANVPIRKAFIEGFNLDQRKWTDAEILKAIELANEQPYFDKNGNLLLGEGHYLSTEEILEQISQIEVIHIDSHFNILSYE
jgi:hypothetical protein